ncbi:MAG: adenylate/guanylate cyclase domain-containing protein, partial [Rubripirellula sp.]
MPDLIAQGPSSEHRWRRELPDPTTSAEIVIGRAGADWNVPWDGMISRSHVCLTPVADDRVEVRCMTTARNAVFHRGIKSMRFTLVPGEHFVIGGTTFTLANRPGATDSSGDAGLTEHAFDHVLLRRKHYRDAASRIEMLSRLPDLITGSGSDEELLVRVTSVLLQATPMASAVAIAAAAATQDDEQDAEVRILHYDSRVPGKDGPAVSARLGRTAIERRESVLHLWSAGPTELTAYTASEEVDWAFCVPLRSEACPGWTLYVTGQLVPDAEGGLERSMMAAPDDLQDDVKFAELVGTTIANLRQSRRLERRQSAMRHFFAPVVMNALAGRDTDEVLAPREANLSVMFCDLRGFTQRSERDADQLLGLLASVSDALGIMTRRILDTDGVIGDFHGDAAMGFWGWPFDQDDAAVRAADAARRIVSDSTKNLAADGFHCGIGIATGRAVAGRIGTVDQVKVTAFGPVVNLASRLEGLTKMFGAKVIVDSDTATAIRDSGRDSQRLRRLARVRPAGLEKDIEAWELLGNGRDHKTLTDAQIADYEASLDALIDGRWDDAYHRLNDHPDWDRPKDVLLSIIMRNDRVPPDDWNGVISLPKF